jgi:hypothetical protein
MTRHKKLMFAFLAIVALTRPARKPQARDNLNKVYVPVMRTTRTRSTSLKKRSASIQLDQCGLYLYAYASSSFPAQLPRRTRVR